MSLRVGGVLVITGLVLALVVGGVFAVIGTCLAVCGGLAAAIGMEGAVAGEMPEADAVLARVDPDHDDAAAQRS